MKKIVSVSLGSSKRDHTAEATLLGTPFSISRRGTDGSLDRAIQLIRELDGQVDAFGIGGIDVYLYVGKKRYVIGDGLKMLQAAQQSPAVDGSGLKNTLERVAIDYLVAETDLLSPLSRVLMVSAADRFGMAEAFLSHGCVTLFGDLMFGFGMDYPLRSLAELEQVAERYKSRLEKLPAHMFYPTGTVQDEAPKPRPEFDHYFQEHDVIAGDFHFIRRYMPDRLDGKVVITNTTTAADVDLLTARGVAALVTTTPVFGGRSFGTNVLEAALIALVGKRPEDVTPDEYLDLIQRLDFQPTIRRLI